MRVLVTRPRAQAAETVHKLKALGHTAFAAPLLETVFLDHRVSGLASAQALVFTSTNGVRAFTRVSGERSLPAFTVGARTAAAARADGFTSTESAEGGARDLVQLLATKLDPAAGGLFFARARQVTAGFSVGLAKAGFSVHAAVLYETCAAERLPAALRTRLEEGKIDAALFFSARTARAFARLIEEEGLTRCTSSLAALTLSERIAAELKPLSWRKLLQAHKPEQEALLALLSEIRQSQ